MKTNAIFFLGMMMSAITFGQMNPQFQLEELQITQPEFLSFGTCYQGIEVNSINNYLSNNVKYSQGAADCCLPGTEVIAFVVTSVGELIDFRVINSVSSVIDDEMVRVLKTTSGNWMPGFINGEPVAMEKEVSLVFLPYDNYDIVKEAKYYLDKGNNLLYVKKNPKRAMKCFNEAFRLRPSNESILAARSICKFELGDEQGAVQDCNRIIALNRHDGIQLDAADPIELLEQLIMGYTVNPIANK